MTKAERFEFQNAQLAAVNAEVLDFPDLEIRIGKFSYYDNYLHHVMDVYSYHHKHKLFSWGFQNPADRDAEIAKYVAEERKRLEKFPKYTNENIKIGDIFVAFRLSGEYIKDKDFVDWYEIVGKGGKTMLKLRKIDEKIVTGSRIAGYGETLPKPGKFISDVVLTRKLVIGQEAVCIDKTEEIFAEKWDGRKRDFERY